MVIALAAVAIAACSGSLGPGGPTSAPTALVAAAATPVPDLKPAAAAAYLAAVTKFNAAAKLVDADCAKGTLAAQKRCLKASFTSLEGLDKTIRTISFPADTTADVRSLLRADAALDALLREAYGAKTLSAIVNVWAPQLRKAYVAAAAASNLVRGDLGLPPVPIN